MTERIVVRTARDSELELTVSIEEEADALLVDRLGAVDWPPSTGAEERSALPGFVLVAEDADAGAVVGFVHVLEIEDHAHLEQLSVLPRYGRRGIGRMLIDAAKAEAVNRGHKVLTLRTYRDVPWNAPFYSTCGFRATEPSTPFLQHLVDVEAALGLDRWGPRVQMTASL